MAKHKSWEAMGKVVNVVKRGGWQTPKQVFEAVNKEKESSSKVANEEKKEVSLRTVKKDLEVGCKIHVFKHDKRKGTYAWCDYVDEEPIIQRVIRGFYESHPLLREGKRDISPADIDGIIDAAAAEIKRPRTGAFEDLVCKVLRKHCEERD